jgi:hypothetical protein
MTKTTNHQSKHWCFTVNNPTKANEEQIQSLSYKEGIEFIKYGREIAPTTGTPHLQGYAIVKKKKYAAGMRKLFGCGHFIKSFGNKEENLAYCGKEDPNPYIYGKLSNKFGDQGRQTGLENLQEFIKSGCYNIDEISDRFPLEVAKYPKFVSDEIERHRQIDPMDEFELRPWQQNLSDELDGPAPDREIIFYVDTIGNCGKSWFADFYSDKRNKKQPNACQTMLLGKVADMSQCIRPENEIFFIDCCKSNAEHLQYQFIEGLKNRRAFKSKYDSRQIRLCKKPHVVVFMNIEPDVDLLSEDRFCIRYLHNEDYETKEKTPTMLYNDNELAFQISRENKQAKKNSFK